MPLARGAVRKNLLAHIAWLEKQLGKTDRDLRTRIEASPIWRVRDQLLQSVPGIGPSDLGLPAGVLARARHADPPPDQQTRGRRPLARRQRPAPGYRRIQGGRGDVRTALYMATVTAMTHNPTIRASYRRWRAAGKLPKVALVAAMHKLLIHLNAMLKHQTAWHPSPAAPTA